MSIRLQAHLEHVSPALLHGFFEGWPDAPTPETLYRMLGASYRVALAIDESSGEVVGFAQAISDGVLTAFIPLLEVKADNRSRGLGTRLMRHLLDQLGHLYAIDLSCDDSLIPFYENLGFQRGTGMVRRTYAHQSGHLLD